LSVAQGFPQVHRPTLLNYNWAWDPAFTTYNDGKDFSGLPAIQFDGKTAYLVNWHTHAPAEHPVNGLYSQAEIHFVHIFPHGTPAAVLAMRIDAAEDDSDFLDQFPSFIGIKDTTQLQNVQLNMNLALEGVDFFDQFWTYVGSLTVPPCTEGIRFFIARKVLTTSVAQMQQLLGMSAYSTRVEQKVWLQGVNA
jgi:carbonic anhydrase